MSSCTPRTVFLRRPPSRWLALTAAALLWIAAGPALAQDGSEALFREGVALREVGDLEGAIERLRRAYRADGDARTGYNLAAALADDGRLVEARTLARRVLAGEPELLIADAMHELVSLITPQIATVRVSVEGGSSGQRLVIDGERTSSIERGAREVSLDPGGHRLELRAEDGTVVARSELEVQAGERRAVVLHPLPSIALEHDPERAAFASSSSTEDGSDDDVWIALGIGTGIAAAILVTVILGVVLSARGDVSIDGDLEDVRVHGRD